MRFLAIRRDIALCCARRVMDDPARLRRSVRKLLLEFDALLVCDGKSILHDANCASRSLWIRFRVRETWHRDGDSTGDQTPEVLPVSAMRYESEGASTGNSRARSRRLAKSRKAVHLVKQQHLPQMVSSFIESVSFDGPGASA
jgi:hypothetical protein